MQREPDRDSPIGIFDSGVGGVTVLAALRSRMPSEDFVYLGDTARLPYGNKSPEVVTRYTLENTVFLLDRGVKAVVIACNTATADSLPRLRTHFRRPVIGVIEPGARLAAQRSRSGRIGVIGTKGTIASGAYEEAILSCRPDASISTAACPLLVPFVEEGWIDHPAARLVVRDYLGPLLSTGVDVLLLGCTHYPLMRGIISEVAGESVEVIDSAGATAEATYQELEKQGLLRTEGGAAGRLDFFLSDRHPHFRVLAERFLEAPIGEIRLISE